MIRPTSNEKGPGPDLAIHADKAENLPPTQTLAEQRALVTRVASQS